jgi:hypothetical protein
MSVSSVVPGESASEEFRLRVDVGLRSIFKLEEMVDGLRVTTTCLYPSNGLVRVALRGGIESLVASDDGEALGEAAAAGIEIIDPDKLLRVFVRQRGLILRNGVIMTDAVPTKAAAVVVAHVANTAKEAATWLYEHGGVKRRLDFRKLLAAFLEDTFRDQVAETRLVGASNKAHRFANVVSFSNGRKLIIDAVANDPSSINARVVANLDVRANKNLRVVQRIVYDDFERWTASDLNLLQVGATIVPFSSAKEVIKRVANETREAA